MDPDYEIPGQATFRFDADNSTMELASSSGARPRPKRLPSIKRV